MTITKMKMMLLLMLSLCLINHICASTSGAINPKSKQAILDVEKASRRSYTGFESSLRGSGGRSFASRGSSFGGSLGSSGGYSFGSSRGSSSGSSSGSRTRGIGASRGGSISSGSRGISGDNVAQIMTFM